MSPPTPQLSPDPVPLGSENDVQHDTGEMPVIKKQLHRELNFAVLKTVAGMTAAIVIATVSTIAFIKAEAAEKAEVVVAPVRAQQKTNKESVDASISDLTKRMDKLEERQDANHREQTSKLDGIYQYMITKQPQPAFDKKPDGGTP